MALTNFIPKIWSARLLENLKKSLVFGQEGVINKRYEGEIRNVGDTVYIPYINGITVVEYTKYQALADAEALSGNTKTLTITEADAFHFEVDDIDQLQAKPDLMDAAMREAAYALADKADQYIASFYTEASYIFKGASDAPLEIDPSTAYDLFVDMAIKLDENRIPRSGRWAIVPPWVYGVLLKDSKFITYTSGAEQRLLNGELGSVAGFKLLISHNAPYVSAAGAHYIMAGTEDAITFAEQISRVEAYRPEKKFTDAVKGLHVYGAAVIRPEALVAAYVKPKSV